MLFRSSAVFSAMLLALAAKADDTHTVTHTNYIYPSGIPTPVAPQNGGQNGIKVVLVYEEGCQKPPPSSWQYAGSSSTFRPVYAGAPSKNSQNAVNTVTVGNPQISTIIQTQPGSVVTFTAHESTEPNVTVGTSKPTTVTVKEKSTVTDTESTTDTFTKPATEVSTVVKSIERTTTNTAEVTATVKDTTTIKETTTATVKTTASAQLASTSPKSTEVSYIFQTETTTQNVEVQRIATATAVTKTTTVYSAKTVPSTIFKPSTTVETITETKSNPLVTQEPVSKSLEKTLPTEYSSAITISGSVIASSSDNAVLAAIAGSQSPSSRPASSSISSRSFHVGSSGAPATLSSSSCSTSTLAPSSSPVGTRSQNAVVGTSSNYGKIIYTLSSDNASTLLTRYINGSHSVTYTTTTSCPESSSYLSSSSLSSAVSTTSGTEQSSSISSEGSSISSGSKSGSSSSASSSEIHVLTSTTSSTIGSSSTVPSSSSAATSTSADSSEAWIDDTTNEDNSGDLFSPISTAAPMSLFPRKDLDLAVPANVETSSPFGTNKFYANLFLDDQTDTIWPLPYGLFWKKQDYYGFGVTQNNVSHRVFGSSDTNNPDVDSYYYSPIGNAELIISATTLSSSNNVMSVSNQKEMSVLVSLSANANDDNKIDIPIVQGMGFVTAVYNGDMVVELNTLIGISSLTQESSSLLASNVLKYRATLFNGVEWLVYVTLNSGSTKRSDYSLSVSNSFKVVGSDAVDGLIVQLASTDGSNESFYDQSAGTYVTDASVSGTVSGGTSASFSIDYTTKGSSSPIVFALPHHQDVLTSSTAGTYTNLEKSSNTKGMMKGYFTKSLKMADTLNPVGFLPSTSLMTSPLSYTAEQLSLIAQVANSELAVDIASTVASMGSNYYSGKVIDKYAYILLVANQILKDDAVTKATLASLKDAFAEFTGNKQHYSLFYDTRYKGITSDVGNEGSGADFGSSYYNDHHFHYGYFVHAAAIVGYVDKNLGGTWAEDNKEWVNSLIRDVANPSREDTYFPVSRSFDWFHGHSWAAGLFASGDGKNEESSSEDYNFAYGMRLWGKVTGDLSMKSRGDLMISIMSRAMNKYFYYKSDNTVEPSSIIGNKVSGILFENKIAYTTYFGTPADHPEYVHGIHMLPITPASSLVRIPSYVKEEWDDQVSTFIGNVDSGWTGILRLNQALYDAKSSYEFFSSSDWKDTYLDNGQSRTWSLAFSAGVSNAS